MLVTTVFEQKISYGCLLFPSPFILFKVTSTSRWVVNLKAFVRPFLLNILCRILFYSFGHNNFCYVDLHSMHKWVYTRKGNLASLFRQMKPLSMPIQGLSYHWQEKCFSFCESSMDIRYFILFILTVIFSANGTSFIACWRSGLPVWTKVLFVLFIFLYHAWKVCL